MTENYRNLSFWLDSVPGSLAPRPGLAGNIDADVAIIGAGYTGLWTAYYLKKIDPALKVVIVESQIAGFGASGRNGGWMPVRSLTSWQWKERRPPFTWHTMQPFIQHAWHVAWR